MKVAIVRSLFNETITGQLLSGAQRTLLAIPNLEVVTYEVAGVFEIPFAVKKLSENEGITGIVTIGAVIKGETPHFDFIASSVISKLTDLSTTGSKPITLGILTTLNSEQARERAGGKLGNVGTHAAQALLQTLSLKLDEDRPSL